VSLPPNKLANGIPPSQGEPQGSSLSPKQLSTLVTSLYDAHSKLDELNEKYERLLYLMAKQAKDKNK
jgi:hypothetical protein